MLRICRTCFSEVADTNFVNLTADTLEIKSELSLCVPELIFDLVADPIMCATCVTTLNLAHKFKLQCLKVEELIKNYMRSSGTSRISLEDIYLTKKFNIMESNSEFKETPCTSICNDLTGRVCQNSNDHDHEIVKEEHTVVKSEHEDYKLTIDEYTNAVAATQVDVEHVKLEVPNFEETRESLTCSMCEYKTKSCKLLVRHMKIHYSSQTRTCEICHVALHKRHFNRHMRMHSGKKRYVCSVCKHKFSEKWDLRRHAKVHNGEKPYSCNLCDFATNRKDSLRGHIKIHTGEKMRVCDVCKAEFITLEDLHVHLEIHGGKNAFSCNLCEFSTTTKVYLKRHSKVHANEERFYCDLCEFVTVFKKKLTAHKVTHDKESFTCNTCNFVTARKNRLVQHMVVHNGDKEAFTCYTCNFMTKRKKNLIRHMIVHSSEKPFHCNVCEFRTAHRNVYNTHLKMHRNHMKHQAA